MDYKEKVRLAKEALESGSYDKETIEYIFPELKESEDEKIRKGLIEYFLHYPDHEITYYGLKADFVIAWLEKQGENTYNKELSELLHKVICRFINDPDIPYSDREKVSMEIIPYVERLEKQCNNMGISEATKKELEDNLNKALEKETPESLNKFLDEQKPADKVEPKFHEGDWVTNGIDFTFKVMSIKDDMYYRDDDYFIDIETADKTFHLWTINDAKDGDVLATLDHILIFKECLKEDGGVSYCHYDFGAGNPQFIYTEDNNWYFGKEAKVYPSTKEQCDLLFQKMHEAGYEWDAEKKELKKTEQKPAWSEDDEERLQSCIKILQTSDGYDTINTKWLKSLKDRVQPQPKQEWSEEDDWRFARIIRATRLSTDCNCEDEDWLKSIKNKVVPQSYWKPSEGQLECLECAIGKAEKDWSPLTNNRIYLTLKALKEQLLELRGSKV